MFDNSLKNTKGLTRLLRAPNCLTLHQLIAQKKMATSSFGYEMEEVSQQYAKYRPTYPPELLQKILQYHDEGSEANGRRDLAVDIGCGCGQSTLQLAKEFESVIGIDNSESQLTQAVKASAELTNISYQLGSAESVSSLLETDSVDLVTVGAAIHFFELPTFYEECLKILKPDGILVVYTYTVPVYDNLEANRLIGGIYWETLKEYWGERMSHVFNGYSEPWTILQQFFDQCKRDDSLSLSLTSNIREAIGLIKSLPQYVFYKRDHPNHPDEVDLVTERLKEVFNTNSTEERIVKTRSPVVLLLGRKPKTDAAIC